MKNITVYVTNRQARYINSLAEKTKKSKSWVAREVIEFHMSNFTGSGGTMTAGNNAHTDGGDE
jgi:predicted transcriptional regulator